MAKDDEQEGMEAVQEAMLFDPFEGDGSAESEEPAQEPEKEAAAETETESEGESEEESESEGEEEGEAAPPAGLTKEALLEQQNQFLQRQLEARTVPPTQTPAAPPKDEVPQYIYDLPDSLVEAIRSEDPAVVKSAMNMLLNNVGRSVHRNVLDEIKRVREAARQEAQQTIKSTSEAQRIEQDFYTKYPQLNAVRPLVAHVAAEVQSETNQYEWSPTLRDKIGQRVLAVLQMAGQGGQQAPAAQSGNKQPGSSKQKTPGKSRQITSRPNVRPAPEQVASELADIQDTLFGRG